MTFNESFRRLRWLIVVALVAAFPAQAPACGFCVSLKGNPLALPHPRAVEIAVATRAAIERGLIKPKCLLPANILGENGDGMIALHKVPAQKLVKAWCSKCKWLREAPADSSIHFLFIDTEEACSMTIRAGALLFDPNPMTHSDTRVVTTRTTFGALLLGTLSWSEASRRGLIIVEADARAVNGLSHEDDAFRWSVPHAPTEVRP